MTNPTQAEVRARINAASQALLAKPYLSDEDRNRVQLLAAAACSCWLLLRAVHLPRPYKVPGRHC